MSFIFSWQQNQSVADPLNWGLYLTPILIILTYINDMFIRQDMDTYICLTRHPKIKLLFWQKVLPCPSVDDDASR